MKPIVACTMAAITIAAAPAFATPAQTARPAGVRVDLDGLDLRTPEGRAGAQQRIEAAVARYCTVDDPSSRARAVEAQCKGAVTQKVQAMVERMAAGAALGKAR